MKFSNIEQGKFSSSITNSSGRISCKTIFQLDEMSWTYVHKKDNIKGRFVGQYYLGYGYIGRIEIGLYFLIRKNTGRE